MKRSNIIRTLPSNRSTLRVTAVLLFSVLACLAVGIASCSISPATYARRKAALPQVEIASLQDGEYAGKAYMFPVKVRVKVAIAAGALTRVDLLEHFNGQGKPAEAIIPAVIAAQNVDVDVVSGATHSSVVILEAIADALKQAERR